MFSNSQLNDKFLPFWLFALRIMSSLNCVVFDMDSSTETGQIISNTIYMCIKNRFESKNKNKIGTDWLNLLLSSVPSEFFVPNIHMFYDFLVYLSKDKHKFINNSSKDNSYHKKKAIEQFTKNVCKLVFDKRTNSFLEKPFGNLTDPILDFINDPNQYINQDINQYYENELDNFLKSNAEKLMNNSKQIEENIIHIIDNLKKSIKDAHESRKFEFLKAQQNNIEQNISQYKKMG